MIEYVRQSHTHTQITKRLNSCSQSIRLGEYNTETDEDCIINGNNLECADPPLDIPIAEKIIHEDYKPDSRDNYNDIALIRLARDIKISRFVQPICLPRGDLISGLSEGQRLTVAGWGQTDLCEWHSTFNERCYLF